MKIADRKTLKPKVGRPPSPEGRVELKASVPPYVKQWLLAQKEGASPTIKRLVDAEMARDQRQADDYDAAQSERRTDEE